MSNCTKIKKAPQEVVTILYDIVHIMHDVFDVTLLNQIEHRCKNSQKDQ